MTAQTDRRRGNFVGQRRVGHGVDEFEIVQPQFSCLPPHRRRLLAGADDAKSHALLSQQMCRVENHIDSVQGQKSSVKQNPT